MASQKQTDANRANAQQSTGPKTPDGKAASSLNALKHGLTRLRVMETGLFDIRLIDDKETQDEDYRYLTSAHRLAHAFYRDCTNRDAFTTLARY